MDPSLKLAMTMHTNPGVYALLLGSGVSRGSGIMTGWEITLDLIRRVAQLSGADPGTDPEQWYRETFGEEPDYSRVLEKLSQSPAERCALLRGYFEPTEEERASGEKVPSRAHRAIADLVKSGVVRVVVTTNFDRLMEQALEAVGVVPDVISSESSAKGAPPLVHSRATLIKVHGDYTDNRIKNTVAELSTYDSVTDNLLDRVFDEYGLVVCGWSAEWDTALRNAVQRCPNRRYGLYWTGLSQPKGVAVDLIRHRRGEFITIAGADAFFEDLSGKVKSLDDIAAPPAISTKVAVATLKRYIVDPASRIRLQESVNRELHACIRATSPEQYPPRGDHDEWVRRLRKHEAASATLRAMAVPLVAWGTAEQQSLCDSAIKTLARNRRREGGLTDLLNQRRYSAMLLLYAAGITATTTGAFAVLRRLLADVIVEDELERNALAAGVALGPSEVVPDRLVKGIKGFENKKTAASDYLHDLLRDDFRELIPDDAEYEDAFDLFEFIWSLRQLCIDSYPFFGRFAWRTSFRRSIGQEIARVGDRWPPFREGVFEVEFAKFSEQLKLLQQHAARFEWM